METKDPSKYYYDTIQETAEQAGITNEQFEQVLSEAKCDKSQLRTAGLTDKGFGILRDRMFEVGEQKANLVPVVKKDLGSLIEDEPVKVKKKKKEKPQDYVPFRKKLVDFFDNALYRIGCISDDFYCATGMYLTACVIIGALVVTPVARRVHYNNKWINAVNVQELTQEQNELRTDIFDYFAADFEGGRSRHLAATHKYFFTAQEVGLTPEQTVQYLIFNRIGILSRATARRASNYIEGMKERDISHEEGLELLEEGFSLRDIDFMKEQGINY